jgi:hypothetical protein
MSADVLPFRRKPFRCECGRGLADDGAPILFCPPEAWAASGISHSGRVGRSTPGAVLGGKAASSHHEGGQALMYRESAGAHARLGAPTGGRGAPRGMAECRDVR